MIGQKITYSDMIIKVRLEILNNIKINLESEE